MKIFKSASKIVLLLMTSALIVLTFKGVVTGDDFIKALLVVFAFYFVQQSK